MITAIWVGLAVVFVLLTLHAKESEHQNKRISILEEKLERLHPWDWELGRDIEGERL